MGFKKGSMGPLDGVFIVFTFICCIIIGFVFLMKGVVGPVLWGIVVIGIICSGFWLSWKIFENWSLHDEIYQLEKKW